MFVLPSRNTLLKNKRLLTFGDQCGKARQHTTSEAIYRKMPLLVLVVFGSSQYLAKNTEAHCSYNDGGIHRDAHC